MSCIFVWKGVYTERKYITVHILVLHVNLTSKQLLFLCAIISVVYIRTLFSNYVHTPVLQPQYFYTFCIINCNVSAVLWHLIFLFNRLYMCVYIHTILCFISFLTGHLLVSWHLMVYLALSCLWLTPVEVLEEFLSLIQRCYPRF